MDKQTDMDILTDLADQLDLLAFKLRVQLQERQKEGGKEDESIQRG